MSNGLTNGYHTPSEEESDVPLVNNEPETSYSVRETLQNIDSDRMTIRRPENNENRTRENTRLNGTVKWFNAKAGYGFVTRHDTGEDIFVHFTGIARKNPRHIFKSMGDGELVEFNILATNVTGPGGCPLRGNPYVSYLPIRRSDSFAAGDQGSVMMPPRHISQQMNMRMSRIPRWNGTYH